MTNSTFPKIKLKEIPDDNSPLQLSEVSINENYRKEWNISNSDFVCLSKNGRVFRDTLYRIGGGLNTPNFKKDKYLMLIKHVEAYYSDDILKMSNTKDPKHLEGKWCILDTNGNEKVEFKEYKSPYLVNNSCIYSIDGKFYNIETGEFYCHPTNYIESTDFLFLDNKYDEDKSKIGIIKINKKSGSYKIFK